MTKETKPSLGTNRLLDRVMASQNLKNDAALSRALGVAPPVVSKLRNGVLPVGPSLVLKIHERFGMAVKEIRAVLA